MKMQINTKKSSSKSPFTSKKLLKSILDSELPINEKRFELALQSTGVGTYDWHIIHDNPVWDKRMHDLFGLPQSAKINRNAYFFSTIHPEDRKEVERGWIKHLDSLTKSQTFEHEYRIILEGKIRHIFSNGFLIRDEKGVVERVIGTCRDITESRQKEEELLKMTERLNEAQKIAKIGSFEVIMKGRICWWSEGAYAVYNVDPSRKPLTREEFLKQVHPEDRNYLLKQVAETIIYKKEKEFYFRMKFPDGTIKYLFDKLRPVLDKDGDLYMLKGTCQDVTDQKIAELKFIESEEKFSKSFHNNITPMAIFDLESGARIELNDSFIKLFGYSRQHFTDTNLHKNNLWANPEVHQKVIQDLKRDKFIKNREADFINSKGQVMTLIINSRMLDIGSRNVGISSFVDITEKKQSKEALKKSEEQYRTLVENSHDLIWEVDTKGNYIFINSVAKEIFGYEPHEMIGKNVSNFITFTSIRETRKIFKEAMKSGKAFTHKKVKIENKVGKVLVINSHGVPRRNEDGEIIGLVGTSQNITQRTKAEKKFNHAQEELSKLTERFILSTDAAKIGTWDWDMVSNEAYWDDTNCDIYGIQKNNLKTDPIFLTWYKQVHPDDFNRIMNEVSMSLIEKREFNLEFRIIKHDQSLRYVRARGRSHYNKQGEAIRMIGVTWDITSEKEAQQQKLKAIQLEDRNKELEQFAYVSSHDLKEPLRTVKSFAELLKKRYEDKLDEDANKYLGFISEAASRMDQVIKALLDYSRIGKNTELTIVECQTILDNLKQDLGAQIQDASITLNTSPLPKVKGYAVEIRMLLQNLISNAIKFRNKDVDSVVNVSAEKVTGAWKFCVADNGIGIDPEYKTKIFEIFQRLHSRSEYDGTGIGLAHCLKILELHEGKIWVESELGKGSSFYFTIPCKSRDCAQQKIDR